MDATQPNLHPTPMAATMAMHARDSQVGPSRLRSARAGGGSSRFAAKLATHTVGTKEGRRSEPASVPGADQHQRLEKQAQKWVAQTFYGTMLKQMHESPFKSKLFEGGRGGEAFGSMFDQKLADHMSRSAGGKLADSIVRKIEGHQAYRASLAAQKQRAEELQARIDRIRGAVSGADRTRAPIPNVRRPHVEKTMPDARPGHVHVQGDEHLEIPPPPHSFRAPRTLYDPTQTIKTPVNTTTKARKHVAAGH